MQASADFRKAEELVRLFVMEGQQLSKDELTLVAKELGVTPKEALRQLQVAQDVRTKRTGPKPKRQRQR